MPGGQNSWGSACESGAFRTAMDRPMLEQSGQPVDAVAAGEDDCSRTEGVTTAALVPRTRADTNAGLWTLRRRPSRISPLVRLAASSGVGCHR